MKKLLLIAALLLAPLSARAVDDIPQTVGPFGTLNNRDSSYTLSSNKAQDLLNIEITEGGRSVKKRKGYATAFTLSNSTSSVHGTYLFYDTNGNDVSLFFNDTRLSASINGGSPGVIFSTGVSGATYQCTDSLGFAYCANSARSALIKVSATTSTFVTGFISTGTMIAATPTRLAMAGFIDAPSRIDFSAETDFNNWSTGSLGSSGVQITINAPGARITHITYAFGRIMWFKDTSFGYILIGNQPLQTDWVNKTVSYDIGTNDNTSVYREGVLYFRGKDSHIYAFDGSNYTRLSKEISATINMSQTRAANSWNQTTQADFAGGTNDSINIDTTTNLGSVQLIYPDFFTGANGSLPRQGNGTSLNLWGDYGTGGLSAVQVVNGVFISTNQLTLANPGTSPGELCMSQTSSYMLTPFAPGTTYHLVINSVHGVDPSNRNEFVLTLSSIPKQGLTGTTDPDNFQNHWSFFFASTASGSLWLRSVANDVDGSLGISTTTSLPITLDFYLATTTYQVSINNVVIKAGSHSWPNRRMTAYMCSQDSTGGGFISYVDDFGITPETGTWSSAVKNVPTLTSWDAFQATKADNNGSHFFQIRSSTNSFLASSSTPSWTAISPGAIPIISTGTYFQINDYFSTSLATATPRLDDFTQNWFEGNASDKMYATFFDNKIMFSVASGAGATTNNRILAYDLLNSGWLLWDIPSNGFYIRQNCLYIGSPSIGLISKYGDTDNDNGSPINSYWKSKDFFGDSPFTDKEYTYLSIVAGSVASSSMTVTYTLNGLSSTSLTIPLYTANNSFSKRNRNLGAGKVGNTFNLQFGNNAADQPFEVFGVEYGIRPKPWSVTNP